MKKVLKMLLIPIAGAIGITVIFMMVVWAGGWQGEVVNEDGFDSDYGQGLVGNVVFEPSRHCSDLYDPVCGHDGNEYDNACFAVRAGTKVAYQGACR